MSRDEAIEQIQSACTEISKLMMKVTPAAQKLEDEATSAAVVKASYQLTIELETIKKQLIRLQKRDDSAEL